MTNTNDDAVPGTLKPRARAVLAMLEHAPQRTYSVYTIARKLGNEHPANASILLRDMADLGLVEETLRGCWSLSAALAVRPRSRS